MRRGAGFPAESGLTLGGLGLPCSERDSGPAAPGTRSVSDRLIPLARAVADARCTPRTGISCIRRRAIGAIPCSLPAPASVSVSLMPPLPPPRPPLSGSQRPLGVYRHPSSRPPIFGGIVFVALDINDFNFARTYTVSMSRCHSAHLPVLFNAGIPTHRTVIL